MVSKNRVTKIRETATSGCWFEQQRGEEIRFSGYTSIDSSLRESYYMSARNSLADIKTFILQFCWCVPQAYNPAGADTTQGKKGSS